MSGSLGWVSHDSAKDLEYVDKACIYYCHDQYICMININQFDIIISTRLVCHAIAILS